MKIIFLFFAAIMVHLMTVSTTSAQWNNRYTQLDDFAITKDDCKEGGWEAFSFKNQGQCIRFIDTGMDSR